MSSFLAACRLQPVDHVPVWFMRQAGRFLPEYRRLRERHSLLDICRTPELAVEASLQPVRRLEVDAAILFSDIMVPVTAMGVDVDIAEGIGPVVSQPLRRDADVARLRLLEPEADVPYVMEATKLLVDELRVPLIGFCGAPFTLACYLVEGGPSKDFPRTRALMHAHQKTWDALMGVLADSVISYLKAQVAAGADAVQLFDSWVGALSAADYRERVWPFVKKILGALEDSGVSRILFGLQTGELLPAMRDAGCDVIGVDWRVPLDGVRRRVGERIALQGNLDPALCLTPWEILEAEARDVLARGGGRAHIFNLGHGVRPDTDPEVLKRLVDFVHEWEP